MKSRIIITLLAVIIGLGTLGLSQTLRTEDYTSRVNAAVLLGEMNDDAAESAPQQDVVNGWVQRDLLEIQTMQLHELQQSAERTQWLLGGVGLLLALIALSALLDQRRGTAGATPAAPHDSTSERTLGAPGSAVS